MKPFRRATFLGFFATVGAGIAVAVVVATAPPQGISSSGKLDPKPLETRSNGLPPSAQRDPVASSEPSEAVQSRQATGHFPATRTPGTAPANGRLEALETASQREKAGGRKTSGEQQSAGEPLSVPVGPILAELHPRVAFQAKAEDIEKAIDYLQKRLAPGSGNPPEAIPAPLPGDVPTATPGKAPAPLPGASPTPNSVAKPTTAARKSSITRAAPGEGDDHLVIHIQDTDIREVLEMLSEEGGLNILASNSVQGKVSATLNDVNIDNALAAILRSTGYISQRDGKFIYVGTPDDFQAMQQAIDRVGTRVYHPNYLTAEDMKALITPLLTPKVGVCSVSAPSELGIGTDDDKVGGDNFAGGEAVLVRDYEAVLAQVDQVVAEIDVRPMQVAIEAMILGVKLDDVNKFGVSFQLLRDQKNLKFGWGTPLNSLAKVDFTKGGLKFGFLDSDLGAFISALESIGDTNVIATPRVMVLNKHRADILIGREDGYVSTTQTETARTQTVEFLDIGAQLRLRPFISSDGLIRMEIHPELSDGQVRELAGFTVPYKDVTKVTTNVMVPDGCTVIIGGLMREVLQTTTTQVPFLGSLPIVGVAFRDVQEETKREEVLVLITPRIVREPEMCREGQVGAGEFERRQAVYAEKMSALGKRHVARCYLRMAQAAWSCGDEDRAMRFAEMAVHFDPVNLDAIELRSRIWSGGCQNAPQAQSPTAISTTAETPLDGPAIAPWLLEGLENANPATAPEQPAQPDAPKYKEIRQPRNLP